MSRQHPWPLAMRNRILISMIVSVICFHCHNLLDDPLSIVFYVFICCYVCTKYTHKLTSTPMIEAFIIIEVVDNFKLISCNT